MSKHVRFLRTVAPAGRTCNDSDKLDAAADALEHAEKQNRVLRKVLVRLAKKVPPPPNTWAIATDALAKCRNLAKKAKVSNG